MSVGRERRWKLLRTMFKKKTASIEAVQKGDGLALLRTITFVEILIFQYLLDFSSFVSVFLWLPGSVVHV